MKSTHEFCLIDRPINWKYIPIGHSQNCAQTVICSIEADFTSTNHNRDWLHAHTRSSGTRDFLFLNHLVTFQIVLSREMDTPPFKRKAHVTRKTYVQLPMREKQRTSAFHNYAGISSMLPEDVDSLLDILKRDDLDAFLSSHREKYQLLTMNVNITQVSASLFICFQSSYN